MDYKSNKGEHGNLKCLDDVNHLIMQNCPHQWQKMNQMQQIDNNQRLRFQLTLYLILFISFSTAIILKNNQELRMNIIEKVNLVYNILSFFINAPLDIIHDLLYDRINYETHLKEYMYNKKRN